MKTLILLLTLITATVLRAQTSTLVAVEENGSRSTRVNMVFLPDGYTSGQMGKFATDVQATLTFLLSKEPWSRYRSYLNIYRIEVASNESGTDNTHVPTPDPRTTPIVLKDTYFHTGFVTNGRGFDRLNTISSAGSSRAYAVLNKHVPEYDIPIVIVNDDTYGGSGGPIAIATTNQFSSQILEHELGHSFAKLTDEYDEELPGYPNTEYPNATAKTVLSQIRWNMWIESGTPVPRTPEYDPRYNDKVGHFEGANYHASGWFRPHDVALMRVLDTPPGSVTREAILLTYYSKVSPIDSVSPTALTQTFTSPASLTLSITPKVPSTAPALSIEWRLNNLTIPGETGTSLLRNTKDLGNGTHKIKAIVRDPTDWVRRDPTALVIEEVTWTLNLSNQTDPAIINSPLPTMKVLPVAASISLDATATGPGQITYQWLKNNVTLKPAVTTPVLSLNSLSLADAGTYTVKITNPGHTRVHSTVLAVLAPNVPRVVIGKGKTATLSFASSTNLPPVSWRFGVQPINNDTHYAAATTRSLQIRNADVSDTGSYYFSAGDYTTSPNLDLLVVTTKPDYTNVALTLPTTIVGESYREQFPLPSNLLQTPNSFSAVMPAGLKIDPKTGVIYGTPTAASRDKILGNEITFIVGNEFGKVTLKTRLIIRPLPPGIEGVFSGLVMLNSSLGGALGGRIDLSVASTGVYTGKVIIGAESFPLNGVLSVADANALVALGSFVLKPKHAPADIQINFQINDGGDSDPLTAMVRVDQELFAWRNKWLPTESLDPFKGYYTFYVAKPTESSAPKGHGFGSLSIDSNGKTLVAGRLADGESFTTSSHLSSIGESIIYQSLYTTPDKGSFISILDLEPSIAPLPPTFLIKTSAWFRPQDTRSTTRAYKAGFGPLSLNITGGFYAAPLSSEIIMNLPAAIGSPLTNGELSFESSLADDPTPVNANVTLELKPRGIAKVNAPNPKLVSFSVTPADGRFKGSYMTKDNDLRPPLAPATSRPQVSRKVDYQGIIVQENGDYSGYGFFLRDALPKADGSTTPSTSQRHSGEVRLLKP